MLLSACFEVYEPADNEKGFIDHSITEERSSFDSFLPEWLLFFTKEEGVIKQDDGMFYESTVQIALPRAEEIYNFLKETGTFNKINIDMDYFGKLIYWFKKSKRDTILKLYYGHFGDIITLDHFRNTSSVTRMEERLERIKKYKDKAV